MNLQETRKQKYKSQVEFAMRFNDLLSVRSTVKRVSYSKIGHWERAQDLPDDQQLEICARLMRLSVEEVIDCLVETMDQHNRQPKALDKYACYAGVRSQSVAMEAFG